MEKWNTRSSSGGWNGYNDQITTDTGDLVAIVYEASEDNIRLMVAAPELLELAEKIARMNPDVGVIGAGMLTQIVDMARAAIAKARGAQ